MAEQQSVSRLVKANTQWTPEQYVWLKSVSAKHGLRSAAAAARMVIQAAMSAESGNDSREEAVAS